MQDYFQNPPGSLATTKSDSTTAANIADVQASVGKPGNIIAYCGTSREGSLLLFYLKHVAGYPNVRLYGGAWKKYVWLEERSLPVGTGGKPAGSK